MPRPLERIESCPDTVEDRLATMSVGRHPQAGYQPKTREGLSLSRTDASAHEGTQAPPRRRRRRTEKLSESVARDIVRDMRGLPPNSMLPQESVLVENYGVGRTTLREALRILEIHGLLLIRPGHGGGPMVAEFDRANFAKMSSLHFHMTGATYRDVIEARLVMEPVMARLAAEREDRPVLRQLQTYLDLPSPDEDDDYLYSVSDFHSLVFDMSGNPVLDLYSGSLKEIYTDRIEPMVFPVSARRKIAEDHARIAAVIVDGDADAAEHLMREHMEEFLTFSADRHPGMLDDVVDWHR